MRPKSKVAALFIALTVLSAGCAAQSVEAEPESALASIPGVEVLPSYPTPPSTPPLSVTGALNVAKEQAEKDPDRLSPPSFNAAGELVLAAPSPAGLEIARRNTQRSPVFAGVPIEYRLVKHSHRALDEVKNGLNDQSETGFGPASVQNVFIDAHSNRVILHLMDGSQDTLETVRDKYGPDIVAVVNTVIPPAPPD